MYSKKNVKVILIGLICLMAFELVAQQLLINEIMPSNTNTIIDYNGESSDWIEIFNSGTDAMNLEGYYLSDNYDKLDKWEFPDIEVPAGGYLLVWASGKDVIYNNGEIHTNFKIKAAGEEVILVSKNGTTIIDQSPANVLPTDISKGRKPGNELDWFVFDEATPGQANTTTAYSGIVQSPTFSHERGFYNNSINLNIVQANQEDHIHYTLDGSKPTLNSTSYSAPIHIDKTTPVRVRVFRVGALSSSVITNTYFFEDNPNLSVVSLVTTHSNFWGSTGIYEHYSSGQERPIHVEYFEKDGTPGFHLDAGVKIHAPDSRPQQSLRIYARASYGNKAINYKIFEDKDIDNFRRLILRNGGNDGTQLKKTHIRDAFTHKIYQQINPDYAVAAYRPVHVYINGNYWGIYNLRERQDEHYIKQNFGYSKDEIDFLEYDYAEPYHKKTIAGNWNDFNSLKEFVNNNNISTTSNYQTVKNWIDIDNFIDYQITEIFIGNQDWCNNNVKFWKPRTEDSKWKWVLWDTEFGLGTYSDYPVGEPDYNFFVMAMTWGGWGNGDYTWMLRKLMDNEEFKWQFVSRTLDLLNTVFKPWYTTNQFDIVANGIGSDINKQFNRWGSNHALWESDLEYTRNFMTQRPGYFRDHMAEKLEFSPVLHKITIDVSDTKMGQVQLNTILIDERIPGIGGTPYPWIGDYFEDIPIHAKAIAKPGYRFIRWEGVNTGTNEEISFQIFNEAYLTAIFEDDGSSGIGDNHTADIQVNIFPVPATNYLNVHIAIPENQKLSLRITNLMGQVLYKKETGSTDDYQAKIDVSSFPSGLYVLVVKLQSGKSKAEKFLVN